MRVGFVRNVGLAALSLAVAVLTACNDDPLASDREATVAIFTNPSIMSIKAGVPVPLVSYALNENGEPTWADVTHEVAPACVTVEDDTTRIAEIQPPGLFVVTGLDTPGACAITLTAGGVTAVVEVNNLAGGVAVTGAVDTLFYGQTVDLSAALLDGQDPPQPLAPIDDSEVTWSVDPPDVASVDESGVVTGTGTGAFTVSACWVAPFTDPSTGDPIEYETCGEVEMVGAVGAPTVTGVSPATASSFTEITIQGSGFVTPHQVYIDGIFPGNNYSAFITSVTDTELTMLWPAFADGAHEIVVGVAPDVLSDPVTFTQAGGVANEYFEPENDDPATAPVREAPFTYPGAFGTGEFDDWIEITVTEDATFDPILYWDTSVDLDLLLYDVDFVNICFSYYSNPEDECGEQTLEAGTYYLLIEDFSAATGNVFTSNYWVEFTQVE